MRSTDAASWTTPEPPPRARDGRSPLERHAVARLRADVAAMPASDVVQLVLWPDTLAHWARDAAVAPAVAYNMLSRFKPYRRVRELLARRLDVPGHVLDHLIDASRPLPSVLRVRGEETEVHELTAPPPPPPGDRIPPTLRLPAVRDGSNPIEQRAVWRVWNDLAALPASLLVQVALFPETLAEWARRQRVPPSMLYAMLAGTQTHPGLRDALARRLGLSVGALALVVDGTRREPAGAASAPLADPPGTPSDHGDAAAGGAAADAASPVGPAARPDQLSLGF